MRTVVGKIAAIRNRVPLIDSVRPQLAAKSIEADSQQLRRLRLVASCLLVDHENMGLFRLCEINDAGSRSFRDQLLVGLFLLSEVIGKKPG